jgi:hypothetical protein
VERLVYIGESGGELGEVGNLRERFFDSNGNHGKVLSEGGDFRRYGIYYVDMTGRQKEILLIEAILIWKLRPSWNEKVVSPKTIAPEVLRVQITNTGSCPPSLDKPVLWET